MRALSLLLLLCSSCIITGIEPDHDWDTAGDGAKTHMDGGAKAKPSSKAADSKDTDFTALEFSLEMAHRKLASAKLSAELGMIEAEHKVAMAQVDVADAQFELDEQTRVVAPQRLAEADLSLDRSAGRLADSRAELAQIVAMYAGEEFAESSKELVIERSRRGVEQAERSLALQRAEREHLETVELPRAALKKQRALDAAKHKLMLAERRLKMEAESLATKQMEAQESVRKAQAALTKARGKAGEPMVDEDAEALQALGYLDMEQE